MNYGSRARRNKFRKQNTTVGDNIFCNTNTFPPHDVASIQVQPTGRGANPGGQNSRIKPLRGNGWEGAGAQQGGDTLNPPQ